MSETFTSETVRFPLAGIPLKEMLDAISAEGKIVHIR